MVYIGCDPDVRDMALGFWSKGRPVGAQVIHVKRRTGVTGGASVMRMIHQMSQTTLDSHGTVEAVAIEGQQIDGRNAKPANLFTLAQSAGSAAMWLHDFEPNAQYYIPTPTEWKGQVPKHAHQARLYADLGWGYTIIGSGKSKYARPVNPPSNFSNISAGQWKHVGDAILLAKWASEQ